MNQRKAHFGTMLRERRTSAGYSLRKFAKLVDVSPTYLSRVETNKAEYPPTAERVRVMAELLGEDADQWTALAGRMPEDLRGIILNEPEAMPALLRATRGMSADQLRELTKHIERKNRDDCTADGSENSDARRTTPRRTARDASASYVRTP